MCGWLTPEWLWRAPRNGGEAQQWAAVLAMSRSNPEAHPLVMEELAGLAEDYSSDRSKARRARGLGGLGFKLKDTKRLNFSEAWAGFGLE